MLRSMSHKKSNPYNYFELVARNLNEKVQCHELGAKLMKENPVNFSFDLEGYVNQVDRDLWNALVLLTQTSNERKGRKQTESHVRERKVKVAYLVSVIVYCATGGFCAFPFHVPLSDLVKASGGSAELITVLNRLGAVASNESLSRHIIEVSAHRVESGLLKCLDRSTFTVSTTDNIDFLQSHASVYSGCQQRSCHYTSVQVVQPLQELKIPVVAPVNRRSDEPVGRRRARSSPSDSPLQQTGSPAAKRTRRARTIRLLVKQYVVVR